MKLEKHECVVCGLEWEGFTDTCPAEDTHNQFNPEDYPQDVDDQADNDALNWPFDGN